MTIDSSKTITQSVSYPKYFLVERTYCNNTKQLEVCLKAADEDTDDGDGFFSCGVITDAENFETACDNLDEEFRYLLNDLC